MTEICFAVEKFCYVNYLLLLRCKREIHWHKKIVNTVIWMKTLIWRNFCEKAMSKIPYISQCVSQCFVEHSVEKTKKTVFPLNQFRVNFQKLTGLLWESVANCFRRKIFFFPFFGSKWSVYSWKVPKNRLEWISQLQYWENGFFDKCPFSGFFSFGGHCGQTVYARKKCL